MTWPHMIWPPNLFRKSPPTLSSSSNCSSLLWSFYNAPSVLPFQSFCMCDFLCLKCFFPSEWLSPSPPSDPYLNLPGRTSLTTPFKMTSPPASSPSLYSLLFLHSTYHLLTYSIIYQVIHSISVTPSTDAQRYKVYEDRTFWPMKAPSMTGI